MALTFGQTIANTALGAIGNGTQSQGGSQSSAQNVSNSYGYSTGGTMGTGAVATMNSAEFANRANEFTREMWEKTAKYNSEEAEKNRKWQEQMSNTSYQRATKDLIKAGLNPILAYTALGGATTGGGAIGSMTTPSSAQAQAYTDNYSKSENYSHGEGNSQMTSWENMSSDLANQIGSIVSGLGEVLTGMFGGKNTSAKTIPNEEKASGKEYVRTGVSGKVFGNTAYNKDGKPVG